MIMICSMSFAQVTYNYRGAILTPAEKEELATKEFVEQSRTGSLLYHGSTIPSDIAGFSTLNDIATSTLTNKTVSSVSTTKTAISQSLTVDGQPNLSIIPAGIAIVKMTAMSSGKDIAVTPTLWSRTSAGVETQIATATDGTITSDKGSVVMYMTITNDTFIDPTDRIFMRLYAAAVGTPAPDMTVYFGGDDDTSLSFPAPSEAFARTNGNSDEDFNAADFIADSIYAFLGDLDTYISNPSDGVIAWFNNGNETMRTTADNNVLIGTTVDDDDAVLAVEGFTKLGDEATGIKMKVLTGTTGSTEGGQTALVHNLTGDNIISVTAKVSYATNAGVPPSHTLNAGYLYQMHQTSSSIAITLDATESENILSKPITVTIWYKE